MKSITLGALRRHIDILLSMLNKFLYLHEMKGGER